MSNESEQNTPPSAELGLDLDLHFLPSWAQKPAEENPYEKYTGQEDVRGRDRRGRPGRDQGRGDRRDRPPRPPGFRPDGGRRPSGPRTEGDRRGPGGFGGGGGRGPRGPQRGGRPGGPPRGDRQDRPALKLPELEVTFIPEDKGVESLARQIKLTGRAYPLFEIAYLVLKKPERYHIELTSKKNPEGQPIQPIYVCGLDDTIWLSEDEAMAHVLDKHFATFYASEKIPTDPPKGTYTFVAQCGMSGTILGPPNYHDYQNKLGKLHQERFARMPFDAFKSRIRIVKDEAVVKKWLEEQSFRTEYTCLNIPETMKLNSREEVENHFRQTHLPNVVKPVDTYTIPAATVQDFPNRAIHALVRRNYDEQMRFPLKVVNILSQQFARQGLQFFKVNKTITHVAVARPKFLDMEATPVSDSVKGIVDFINSHPKATRKQLLENLAPGQPTHTSPAAARETPAPAAAEPPAGEATTQPAAEAPPAPAPESSGASAAASPQISAIVSDLHWLIHQGHVIEFANGILETAKKPIIKPPKPPKQKPAEAKTAGATPAEGEAQGEGEQPAPETSGEAQEPSSETEAAAETESHSEEQPSVTGEIRDESGTSAGAQVVDEAQPAQEANPQEQQPEEKPAS